MLKKKMYQMEQRYGSTAGVYNHVDGKGNGRGFEDYLANADASQKKTLDGLHDARLGGL